MVHIAETFTDDLTVEIRVDGNLDHETMPVLKDLCLRYFQENVKISLNLNGLLHINREGIRFLHDIQHQVSIVDPPRFLKM